VKTIEAEKFLEQDIAEERAREKLRGCGILPDPDAKLHASKEYLDAFNEDMKKARIKMIQTLTTKNPHAVALGRKGGKARKGKPGRKLTSEEAKRIRALRDSKKSI
jgi:hypothetical protein